MSPNRFVKSYCTHPQTTKPTSTTLFTSCFPHDATLWRRVALHVTRSLPSSALISRLVKKSLTDDLQITLVCQSSPPFLKPAWELWYSLVYNSFVTAASVSCFICSFHFVYIIEVRYYGKAFENDINLKNKPNSALCQDVWNASTEHETENFSWPCTWCTRKCGWFNVNWCD